MAPSDMSFVPKENVPCTFGRQTVYVYPELASDMSYSEKSYGFMVTKSALEAAFPLIRCCRFLQASLVQLPW
jgi:hypothetical protein